MNIESLFKFSMICYDCGLYIKEIIAKFKYRKWNRLAKKNKELIKYKKSEKCYICGNGPSLNKVDLDELDGDIFAVNDHWRIAPNFMTPPTFYIINDNAYGLNVLAERMWGVLNCFPQVPHVLSTYLGPAMDTIYNKNNANIYFYNNIGRTFRSKYSIDFTRCTYYTWNVVTAAIQLALYLGYKEIYLLGCDYSLFATRHLEHAYDKDGEKMIRKESLCNILFKYSITTQIHYEVAKYASDRGVRIINLTNDSLLDAYEIDQNSNY